MSSLLSDLSVVYRNALNTFKKSEQYKREMALNIFSDVIPFSSRSKYYKSGLYGIEMINSEYSRADRVYHLYCDLKFLLSDVYTEFITDTYITSKSRKISLNFNLIIMSNNDNLSDILFDYYDFLRFNKDLDLSGITLNLISNINREDLINLYPLNINYKFSKSDFSVLLHDTSAVDIVEDRKFLLFLNSILPNDDIINIDLIFNHIYSVYYLNKLFMGFVIFDRCFNFSYYGFNGPLFIVDKLCFHSPFDMSFDPLHDNNTSSNFLVDGRRFGENESLPSKWHLSRG